MAAVPAGEERSTEQRPARLRVNQLRTRAPSAWSALRFAACACEGRVWAGSGLGLSVGLFYRISVSTTKVDLGLACITISAYFLLGF